MRLTRKTLGLIMMIGGGLIALAGVGVRALAPGDQPPEQTSTSTSVATTAPTTTTSTVPQTTTTIPIATSTTLPASTTTTIDVDAAIAAFVPVFADAIDREDSEFLFDTLHPTVVALFDEATCRTFITEEILQLGQYRLIGEVDGPTTQQVADTTIDLYQAPVAFVFQGQEFTSEAAFALVDGEVRWFTQCGGV